MSAKGKRTPWVLLAAVLSSVLAMVVQFVVDPSPLPDPGQYFLSELAVERIGPASITVALAAAFALGFFARPHPVLVGVSMVAVFPIISLYEAARFQGSHNLLPFEFVLFALWALPAVAAAWGGRALARRYGQAGGPRERDREAF